MGRSLLSNRIRICLVVDDLGPDAGTERQVEATVRCLHDTGFDVYVCCFFDSERLRRLASHATTVVFPVQRVWGPAGWHQIFRFRAYLQQHRIQVVHSWMVNSTLFSVIAAVGTDCCVISSRLNTGYWYTPTYLQTFRVLNLLTDRVFANSQGAKRIAVAAERLSPSKVDVIYNGVDMQRYSIEAGDLRTPLSVGIPADALVVGIVANLRPVKNLVLFLRAAALVAARVPNAAFVVVGRGPLRDELGRLAVELRIADRVFFSDGHGAVQDYLCRMCVACLTSKSEGFSNAILEYMAAGLPTVATDVGGNAEAIVEGVTGYLVRQDPEAVADRVIRLLESEDLRKAMGQHALERCRTLFSMEVYRARMSDYYRGLVLTSTSHVKSTEKMLVR